MTAAMNRSMKKTKFPFPSLALVLVMVTPLCGGSTLLAEDPTLAEDPFAVDQAQHQKHAGKRPWVGKSPEELRKWAKQNLHQKLTARKVIDAAAHPEWGWFRESGLGLFLHWGPASLPPANGDAWAMVWNEHRSKHDLLQKPEAMFAAADIWNPQDYDPGKWMEAASRAGFGYAVLTTRHHDGYCLWPSAHGDWDTGDRMGGRDLVQGYVDACRDNGLRVGLYYSGPNWHFDYKQKDFSHPPVGYNYRHEKVDADPPLAALMGYDPPLPGDRDRLELEESTRQVRELMSNYGPIDIMWWDGNLIMTEEELARLQPDVFVARGNIATPEGKHHGTSENVKVTNEAGWWWELCIKSEKESTPNWHYSPDLEANHWGADKLLSELVRCRALGGNLLVNVPPRPNGEMMDWFYEVCDEMAGWMAHSREAVQGVDLDPPRPTLGKTRNSVTTKGDTWYAEPDDEGNIFIEAMGKPTAVTLLRTGAALQHDFRDGSLRVLVPEALRSALPDLVKIEFGVGKGS